MVLDDWQLLDVFGVTTQEGMEGTVFVCPPPPRDAKSSAAVWRALSGEMVQTFSSDHRLFLNDDASGKTGPEARAPFRGASMGSTA